MKLSGGRLSHIVPVLFGLSTLLSVEPATSSELRRLDLADLGRRVDLTSPAISPDGKHVAVITSRVNYDRNQFQRTLVVVEVKSGSQRPVTNEDSRPESLQWSPRGDKLAWIEADKEGATMQICLIELREPAAVPRCIASAIRPVQAEAAPSMPSFAWSPDGRQIAFVSAEPAEQRGGDERHNRSFEVVDGNYLATRAPVASHLWVVAAGGGEARRLTSGRESVKGLAWLADSRSLAFVSQPRPYDGEFMQASSRQSVLRSVELETGEEHDIVPGEGRIAAAPQLDTGAKHIAFLQFSGPEPWTRPKHIAVVGTTGGPVVNATEHIDSDISEFAWLPNSQTLIATAPDATRDALWVQPPVGPAHQVELSDVRSLNGLSVSDKGVIAFIGTEARHLPELYVMTSVRDRPNRITHFNDLTSEVDIGTTETVTWNVDGFNESGVLIYPPGFKRGQKIPLVLNIHGGPEGTSSEAFDLFTEILAAQGWAVFKPNYRGSTTQGDAFQRAVVEDLGDGPGRDVMAGIEAVKARGFVDPERVAVSGWSYGGYMTAWLIGHYQGWRAAVVGSAITNYLDWYDLSCCNVWANPTLGGSPWTGNSVDKYWRYSPVAYASQVKVPTLILAHAGDSEVPVTQSYNLYHALRDNGVEVKFVVYPLEGHTISLDPVHERDTYRRWLTWINEHLN